MIPAAALLIGLAVAGIFFSVFMQGAALFPKERSGTTVIPFPILSRLSERRRERELRRQLPSALFSLAASVRAGLSLPQAIKAAARTLSWPLGDEFRILLNEVEHGGNFDQALAGLGRRTCMLEIKFMVTGLRVARASGGGLAPLLERLADAIRERERLRGQARSLTAQGRLSGWIVGAIPFVLLAGIGFLDPTFIEPLFLTGAGWLLLAITGILEVIGIIAIRAVVSIEP